MASTRASTCSTYAVCSTHPACQGVASAQPEPLPLVRRHGRRQLGVLLQVGADERAVGQHADTSLLQRRQGLLDEARAQPLPVVRVIDLRMKQCEVLALRPVGHKAGDVAVDEQLEAGSLGAVADDDVAGHQYVGSEGSIWLAHAM